MLFKIAKQDILASNEIIESGAYFSESINWYNEIFLSLLVNRFGYLLFFLIYSLSGYLAFTFGSSLFPLQETKQIMIFLSRDSDTYVSKRHLTRFDNPAKNIVSVMLENYVLQREQYILDGGNPFEIIEGKNAFMKRYSSQRIFADFKDELNAIGSRGDKLLNNVETHIQITDFNFIIEDESVIEHTINNFIPTGPPKSAQIEFIINGQKRVATMSYIFDLPYSKAKGNNAKIKLTIIDYNVARL